MIEGMYEGVTSMARAAVAGHPHRVTTFGKPFPNRDEPITSIMVMLPPEWMFELAKRPGLLPREIDGLPVIVSEKPSQVNKPSGRYMLSVWPVYVDPRTGRNRNSAGRLTLTDAMA
jgi:hypothetical protein